VAGRGVPAEEGAVHLRRLVEDPDGGWLLTLAEGDQELVVRCGDRTWQETSLRLPAGRQVVVAASATGDPSTVVVQLAFVQTPHRLVLTVDRQTQTSSARWLTVPLHAPTLAGLAVGSR
jgi:hypothetical protein